jgi:3-isopropylmalate dehydrogenase
MSTDKKHIAVVPGDGIGKEVIPTALEVLRASGAPLEFTNFDWGADRYLLDGTTMPEGGFDMLARNFDAVFVGALGDPRVPSNIHAKEILLGMRFQMDLYANVRPVRLLDESLCPLKNASVADVNFTVIRENTEGVYAGMGGNFKFGTPDEIATQEDINTRKGVERIIRFAFDYARSNGRKKVLMADKSNVMTYAGGLWQRVFKQVSAEYSDIVAQHRYVDALCLQMVREPRSLDVIVTNNMFGDIVTDLAAALQGGLGMAASGNIHPGRTSMFEPVHGSAPPIAGKDMANPMGSILTGAMMLAHLGLTKEAASIEAAVEEAVREKKTTIDVGGSLGTRECAQSIAERVGKELRASKPMA